MKNQFNQFIQTDNKSFEFNLESNERIDKMMKYEIKDTHYGYKLFNANEKMLIQLGDIWLCKPNCTRRSVCCQKEDKYEYHGIQKALCGKVAEENNGIWKVGSEIFTPIRIRVIQMN